MIQNKLQEIRINELPLVGPVAVKKLEKLGIKTIWDLLHYVPFRFLDFTDENATIRGEIVEFRNQYTRTGKAMQIVTIKDKYGKEHEAMWFNQTYLSRTFKIGGEISIAGELSWFGRKQAIISPEYEILGQDGKPIHTVGLVAIYSETAGISSKWLRRRVFDAWKRYGDEIAEFLPEEIRKKYNLVDFKTAIHDVHFPKSLEEFDQAKHRLAFNELLALHVKNMQRKKAWTKNRTNVKLQIQKGKIDEFITSLPFGLTLSQRQAVEEMLIDVEKEIPMNRLLEGDVGSGKTIVAAIVAYAVFVNGKRVVLMAPTQILATQHFNTFKEVFKKLKIKVNLVTGTSVKKNHESAHILIGTHALLNKGIDMKNVGLVIIDEQHKFGVDQRNILVKKSGTPHILTMTATPIPRTIALTIFGDLELSTLKDMPKNRQRITTWIVPEEKRNGAYGWIEKEVSSNKSQVFVVCPLIDISESETLQTVKSASNEYSRLTKIFKNLKVGLMHGRLKAKEKEQVISDFKNGGIDILVTTPVVEVGIDIPNATIMVIEGADRFGLASLHQLRGRVGRGVKKSYCLLMTENASEKTALRLTAMKQTLSGFELAELDLKMRGPGEIYGARQSGFAELKIASWSDFELIKNTREVALSMVK